MDNMVASSHTCQLMLNIKSLGGPKPVLQQCQEPGWSGNTNLTGIGFLVENINYLPPR